MRYIDTMCIHILGQVLRELLQKLCAAGNLPAKCNTKSQLQIGPLACTNAKYVGTRTQQHSHNISSTHTRQLRNNPQSQCSQELVRFAGERTCTDLSTFKMSKCRSRPRPCPRPSPRPGPRARRVVFSGVAALMAR